MFTVVIYPCHNRLRHHFSDILGVGKKNANHKLVKRDTVLRSCANAFTVPNQPTAVIDNIGCQVMAALFEARDVFRKTDKPQVAHAISEYAWGGILDFIPETERHVLDGGSLLHRIP